MARRGLEERCAELTGEAARLHQRGRGAQALTFYTEALDIAGKLARADPADSRPIRQQASILYALGALYIDARRWDAAVTVLEDSEKAYRELAGRGVPGTEQLIADVKARRGRARMIGGRGASAVLELDEAVASHRRLLAGTQTAERSLDMARILTSNAVVLERFGDPDLAVASADSAIRLYMSLADAINSAPDLDFHFGYLQAVADVAARLHAASGRMDLAIQADDLAIHAVRALAKASRSAGAVPGQADQASQPGQPDPVGPAGQEGPAAVLAARLTRKGLHLEAVGQPGRQDEAASCLAEGRALDAAAGRRATSEWEQSVASGEPVTLASGLETAARILGRDRVRKELAGTVTAPATAGRIMSPSDRCAAESASAWAHELAGIAVDLLPRSADAGLRIGLEAHYLYAVGTRRNPPGARHQFDSFGIPWARLLLDCCRVLAAMDADWALLLALDLASWNFGVIIHLQPFVVTAQRYLKSGKPGPGGLDTSVVPLVRDCLSLHAGLHVRNGDDDAAQQLRQIAKLLGMTI
jgi:tetratricopeptide (TPR) repeat protein